MTARRAAALKREARKRDAFARVRVKTTVARGVILNTICKLAKVDPYVELATYAIAHDYSEAELMGLVAEAQQLFPLSNPISDATAMALRAKLRNAYRAIKDGYNHGR